jgi:histidine triad (HIT) family protein
MEECLFCNIISGKLPSYTVYEDADTKAFLDIYGSAPGHTVVILKTHGKTIHEYAPDDLGKLMKTVQTVADALEKAFGTSVLTIGINHGEPLGVHHLHIHIIPRTPDDEGGVIQSIVKRPFTEDFAVTQKRIQRAFTA